MSSFAHVFLTLAAGGIFGWIFMLLKIPNGLRIGALFGTALLSIFFDAAWVPSFTKYVVQIVAGALVGCTIEKSDLKRLPSVVKPIGITLGMFLFLNLGTGVLIHAVSPLNWASSLMSTVPGGVTDIPIIAADMGGDPPKIALLQLARYILGCAVFPPMILAWDNFRVKTGTKKETRLKQNEGASPVKPAKREISKVRSPAALVCTLAVGLAGGLLGNFTGIPGGAFLFSTVFVLVLKLKFDFAYVSPGVKKAVLLISGCYIGSLMTMDDVRGFRMLALPLVIVLGGYIANSFVTGKILSKTCGFSRKEGMLITAPAGAPDIALSSADIGVENTDIIIIQISRAIIAAAVFPQIINLFIMIFV